MDVDVDVDVEEEEEEEAKGTKPGEEDLGMDCGLEWGWGWETTGLEGLPLPKGECSSALSQSDWEASKSLATGCSSSLWRFLEVPSPLPSRRSWRRESWQACADSWRAQTWVRASTSALSSAFSASIRATWACSAAMTAAIDARAASSGVGRGERPPVVRSRESDASTGCAAGDDEAEGGDDVGYFSPPDFGDEDSTPGKPPVCAGGSPWWLWRLAWSEEDGDVWWWLGGGACGVSSPRVGACGGRCIATPLKNPRFYFAKMGGGCLSIISLMRDDVCGTFVSGAVCCMRRLKDDQTSDIRYQTSGAGARGWEGSNSVAIKSASGGKTSGWEAMSA